MTAKTSSSAGLHQPRLEAQASERVTLELGPRSEHEIRSALEKDVAAERWTGLDRALRDMADDSAGIADLRPQSGKDDPEIRRLLVGRAQTLERLGLAEQIAPDAGRSNRGSRRRCARSLFAAISSKPCTAPCRALAGSRM